MKSLKQSLIIAVTALVLPSALLAENTVYINATVISLDDSNTIAEAVAFGDEHILAVGSKDKMISIAGANANIVDLQGATVLPGFIDAHGHFPADGLLLQHFTNLNSAPIGSVVNVDDIVDRLKERAQHIAAGEWVRGYGYDDTLLTEKRHPTRVDLDKVSTVHPILISHISGHLSVANSFALKAAGINADTPQPRGGHFRKDADGKPNGIMEEPAAMNQVSQLIPPFSDKDVVASIATTARAYAAVGVTTAQNGAARPAAIKQTMAALDSGQLSIRVQIWPMAGVMMKVLDGKLTMPFPKAQNMVKVGALKAFSDGSIQGYTGYLNKPYHVHPAGQKNDYRGYPTIEQGELIAMVTRLHGAGHQLAIHANGDQAIDNVLQALGQAQRAHPRKDSRHIIIHAQMARDDQLDKMKALGVIPSFFNLHTYYWGDRHRDIFMGPKRAQRMSPARSAVERDMPFTLHADTPVVPMEPMKIVWAAVNRLTSSGKVIGPEQRISVVEALKGITVHAAWQGFEEDIKGTIEAGKLADLVIVDRNPLTVPPEDIKDIQVFRTLVGGNVVYNDDTWQTE